MRSTFVSVVAWVFIVLGGFSTLIAVLQNIMIAVVFLYIISAIFILGGELNAAISRYFEARARVRAIGDQRPA